MPPGMRINPSQHCLFMIILRQCRRMIGRMNQWCGWLPGKVYLTWSTARCWVLCMLVTGNPLGSDLFEMTSPASVVQGQEFVWPAQLHPWRHAGRFARCERQPVTVPMPAPGDPRP